MAAPRRAPEPAPSPPDFDLPPRSVVVAGHRRRARPRPSFAAGGSLPLLADPLSGARTGPAAIAHYDALLRAEAFVAAHRPEAILRVGDLPTSKPLRAWLAAHADVEQIVIPGPSPWPDPMATGSRPRRPRAARHRRRRATRRGSPTGAPPTSGPRAAIDAALGDELSEPRVARELAAHARRGRDALRRLLDAGPRRRGVLRPSATTRRASWATAARTGSTAPSPPRFGAAAAGGPHRPAHRRRRARPRRRRPARRQAPRPAADDRPAQQRRRRASSSSCRSAARATRTSSTSPRRSASTSPTPRRSTTASTSARPASPTSAPRSRRARPDEDRRGPDRPRREPRAAPPRQRGGRALTDRDYVPAVTALPASSRASRSVVGPRPSRSRSWCRGPDVEPVGEARRHRPALLRRAERGVPPHRPQATRRRSWASAIVGADEVIRGRAALAAVLRAHAAPRAVVPGDLRRPAQLRDRVPGRVDRGRALAAAA